MPWPGASRAAPRRARAPPASRCACACAARARRPGSSSMRFSMRATQSALTGQSRQCGLRARHTLGAQVHHALRVALDPIARKPRLGLGPQALEHLRARGIARDARMAREHAPHVAVEDRAALAAREGRDRRRGRAPHAGQLDERFERTGKCRRTLRHLARGAGAGCARARSSPARSTARARRPRTRRRTATSGKRARKALVVRNHGRDLRLLQHDLREPDAIGVARALPRQAVAAVAPLPDDDARGERGRARHAASCAMEPCGRGGAGEGNRTLVVSLGSFCSAIELHPHLRDKFYRHWRLQPRLATPGSGRSQIGAPVPPRP